MLRRDGGTKHLLSKREEPAGFRYDGRTDGPAGAVLSKQVQPLTLDSALPVTTAGCQALVAVRVVVRSNLEQDERPTLRLIYTSSGYLARGGRR